MTRYPLDTDAVSLISPVNAHELASSGASLRGRVDTQWLPVFPEAGLGNVLAAFSHGGAFGKGARLRDWSGALATGVATSRGPAMVILSRRYREPLGCDGVDPLGNARP